VGGWFILVVSTALMNLITALMVENALAQAENDKEANKLHQLAKKKKMVAELHDLFQNLDKDGSGDVDLAELLSSLPCVT